MPSVSLRRAEAQDEPFLQELYFALRRSEFQVLQLPEGQLRLLVQSQYVAQVTSYSMRFPTSTYDIVLIDDEPAGRIWIDRQTDEIRIVDIVIDSTRRNKGTGSILIQQLQDQARQAALPIRATVDRGNPGSLRFHQRHGFVIFKEEEFDLFLEWKP